ncbi:hypothetical protein V8F06_010535 [Rhypophila decipiens]
MPLPYKPAADSRHRRACFALYRALVRQGLQIPLPHDILESTKDNPIPQQLAPRSSYFVRRKDGNPIPSLITHAFRRNRKLDSTRLVCLALKNGYRFLDLFAQAKAQAPPPYPTRPIYNSIIQFLGENQARVTKYLVDREASKKPNPFKPHLNHVPLLTLLPPTKHEPGPVYAPTVRPRPLSALSGGVRKLPTLDDCAGYPFLRLSKPQSPVLSVMIWSNARSRQKRAQRYHEMKEEDLEMGRLEDEWDLLVESMHQAVVKRGKRADQASLDTGPSAWHAVPKPKRVVDWANRKNIGYQDSWKLSIDDLEARLTRQHELWVARGRALWGIVEAERALAEKEAKEQGRRTYKRPVGALQLDKIKDWNRAWERRQLRQREEKIKVLEEKGDLEGAEKLRSSKFVVQNPRRRGFKKKDMVEALHA